MGVWVDSHMNFAEHWQCCYSFQSDFYLLQHVMKKQGLNSECLMVVFSSIAVSKILYALPAWGGYMSHDNINCLNKIPVKGKRCCFYPHIAYSHWSARTVGRLLFHVPSAQTTVYTTYYARPLSGGIKRWCCRRLSDVCLTSVCLSHTSGLSREQGGLGRLKLAQR